MKKEDLIDKFQYDIDAQIINNIENIIYDVNDFDNSNIDHILKNAYNEIANRLQYNDFSDREIDRLLDPIFEKYDYEIKKVVKNGREEEIYDKMNNLKIEYKRIIENYKGMQEDQEINTLGRKIEETTPYVMGEKTQDYKKITYELESLIMTEMKYEFKKSLRNYQEHSEEKSENAYEDIRYYLEHQLVQKVVGSYVVSSEELVSQYKGNADNIGIFQTGSGKLVELTSDKVQEIVHECVREYEQNLEDLEEKNKNFESDDLRNSLSGQVTSVEEAAINEKNKNVQEEQNKEELTIDLL